jgi:hypothetical protein
MRNEAPSVYITAYQPQYSQLRQFIDGYLNILTPNMGLGKKKGAAVSKTPGLDFYRRMYATSSTPITRLNLPFFTDSIRAFTSEYADTFSPVSQRGAQMLGGEFITGLGGAGESVVGGAAALAGSIANIGAAAENSGNKSVIDKVSKAAIQGTNKAFNAAFGTSIDFQKNEGLQTIGAPGTYIETPKFYQYSPTDAGLEISFALSNTLNNDGRRMNHKFIKDFTRMNRPFRTGPIGMTFPAIYNIVLPGQRYIQWAFLESFNVNMLGMRRRIRLSNGGSEVVPEGYTCNFNFRSLTLEAANFIDEMDRYGDFASGENSYAELKGIEEAAMQQDVERLNRAAMQRQERLARASSTGGSQRSPLLQDYTAGRPADETFEQARHASAGSAAKTPGIPGYSTTTSVSPAEARRREDAARDVEAYRRSLASRTDTEFGKEQQALLSQQLLGEPGSVFKGRQGFLHKTEDWSSREEGMPLDPRAAALNYGRATGQIPMENQERDFYHRQNQMGIVDFPNRVPTAQERAEQELRDMERQGQGQPTSSGRNQPTAEDARAILDYLNKQED